MSDSEFQENILRDLCAASNFGLIDGLLADFRALNVNQPAQLSSPPKRPSTPIRSRGRFRGKLTAPDDDRPTPSMGRGRGTALEELGVAVNGYEVPHELSQGLMEIGSGSHRNESIEAYIIYEQEKKQAEDSFMSDSDENKGFVDATKDVKAASPRGRMSPSSLSPAETSTPVVKTKAPKKQRNVILRSYLEKKTTVLAEDDNGTAKPAVSGESVSKVTVESVADEDANSDAYVLNGNIGFLGISDSFTSSEIEVESQESYLVDDGQASSVNDSQTSDDLQVSVEELTDLSASSSSSKRSSNSKKSSDRSSSSSKSPKSYHGTSRRKRMVPMSPLLLQNPTLGRRSPLGNVYVPKIVDTSFTLSKRDFPPLSR